MRDSADSPRFDLALTMAVAGLIAVLGAKPWAGCWNDGSRLATVEALVDHRTLAIDDSIFVHVPDRGPPVYDPDDPGLALNGTGDKLLIGGHFYSDKSPVPALLMAGAYAGLQATTGLTAQARPDLFTYYLTLLSSGLAYVVAVGCTLQMARELGLDRTWSFLLAASMGLASVALPYSRHANNHILLLGVSSALLLQLLRLAEAQSTQEALGGRLVWIGFLAGLGYAIDLGTGPPLLACAGCLVAWRTRAPRALLWLGLGAAPWLILHHAVNYAVGGTWKPANANAEYFDWPGCTFTLENMTGVWSHSSAWHFVRYSLDLLLGKNGFLGHNLPLFLAVLGFIPLLRSKRLSEAPELMFAAVWSVGTWLVYAITSTNHSGACCSVRWFVPLLAPGYAALAVLLREKPEYRLDFLALSTWGAGMGALMWWKGPWMRRMVPGFWFLLAGALLSWLYLRVRAWRANGEVANTVDADSSTAQAA